jgi:hypothetical protein
MAKLILAIAAAAAACLPLVADAGFATNNSRGPSGHAPAPSISSSGTYVIFQPNTYSVFQPGSYVVFQ